MNLIEELRWRGMVHDIMPGTEEQLSKEMTTGYVGFDPTAESLHIGSLVPIILLVHMQRSGHKPIALIGGATGMIGDPSGKSEERNLLNEETLAKNITGIKKQLERFLDFDPKKINTAEMANNYDWFKDIGFIEFLRDTGKHITVNYMMAKDSVRKRIEGETGISYTEFAYQLMQGYDFYWLYKNRNCKLQFGGSDQWGNMTTGTELIRRKASGEAFVFTNPLITKSDGNKFGKTEQGNVWLDAQKTSPFQFYQFWLNAADEDAEKWIKIFTFLPKEEIEKQIEKHKTDASKRILQKRLAKEVTIFVHGEEDEIRAEHFTNLLFGNVTIENLLEMSGNDYQILAKEIPFSTVSKADLNGELDIVHLLVQSKVMPSKGEARRMIQNGGISINKKKVDSLEFKVDSSLLLHDQYLLIQKGRKNYYLLEVI